MTQRTDLELKNNLTSEITSTGNGDITGAVLREQLEDFVDSKLNAPSLEETSTEIVSKKTLVAPDASLKIGNWRVSNGAFLLAIEETATETSYYPVATELQTGGTTAPYTYALGAVTDTAAAANKSETFTGTSIQFSTQSVNTGIVTRYTYDSTVQTTGVNFVVRVNSHTDDTPIFDYNRATGTFLTLESGENSFDLPVPLFFEAGTTLYVTVTSANNLSLRGQTISSQTVPYLASRGRLATRRNIAYESELTTQNPYIAMNGRNSTGSRNFSTGDLVFVLGSGEYDNGLDIDNFKSDVNDLEFPIGILIKDIAADTEVDGAVLVKGAVQITQTGLSHTSGSQTKLYLERFQHSSSPVQYRWRFSTTRTADSYFIGHLVFQESSPANTYRAYVDFSYLRADELSREETEDSGKVTLEASGAAFYRGRGGRLSSNSAGEEVAVSIVPTQEETPTFWANASIASGASGEFISEGIVEQVTHLNSSGASRVIAPVTVATDVYRDIAREIFTLDSNINANAKCGAISASGYKRTQSTFWSGAGLQGNHAISSEQSANGAKNQTLVMGNANSAITYQFEIPNLNLNQAYSNAFVVGDQIAFVNPSGSNVTWNIVQNTGGTFQNLAGTTISSYTINSGNAIVIERIANNTWKVVFESDDIVQSDIVVSNAFYQNEQIKGNKDNSDNAMLAVRGLVDGFITGTTSTSQVTIGRGEARSDDGTYTIMTTSSVNITLANDLDTGSPSNSRWYFIRAFANPSTDAVQFKFSTNNSSPSEPSNFTKKRLLGAVYRESNGNFRGFGTYGQGRTKKYVYDTERTTLSNASYTTRSLINLSSTAPLLPTGYPLLNITIEYRNADALIYNGSETTTRMFSPEESGIAVVTDLVLNSSGQFGLGGNGSGITGVYLKTYSFNLEL